MYIFLIAAITLDGFIAQTVDQVSTIWTSGEDKKIFTKLTRASRVMVMGRKTYDTIGRALPGRLSVVMSQSGKPMGRVSVRDLEQGKTVVTSDKPEEILATLEQAGFAEVAICGGGTVYTQFVQAGLVDKFYLTVEPVLFGRGVGLLSDFVDVKLTLVKETKLNDQGTRLLELVVSKTA